MIRIENLSKSFGTQTLFDEGNLALNKGERLDSIIQKFAMILSNGLGACTSSDLQHDPYNVYAGPITSSTAEILWNGVWSSSTGVNIYLDTQIAPGGWVLQNTTPIATTIFNLKLTNLPSLVL